MRNIIRAKHFGLLLKAAILSLLLLIALLAVSGFWFWRQVTAPLTFAGQAIEIEVAPGASLRAISQSFIQSGIEIKPWIFSMTARFFYQPDKTIKAGIYEVNSGNTLLDALDKLKNGKVVSASVTFIEGWTFRQMRAAIDTHPELIHDTKGLSEHELIRKLNSREKTLEGLFFPDTYHFPKKSSDIDLLRRAYGVMQRHLSHEWANRDPNLPYKTPYEALIMASIIERETGRDEDRGLVSAVFANRLRKDMLLQTDPTVIYGLGDRFNGNLRKIDLQTHTPYNTYTRPGLPPTPIASPGLASIKSALHPEKSNVLYFVSRNDGSSQFSSTLEEHNIAVNRYQRRK